MAYVANAILMSTIKLFFKKLKRDDDISIL